MIHARYPRSSNHSVFAVQRGVTIAKGIVGVAILGSVLAMVALAARDVQHSPSPQARSGVSSPSPADAVKAPILIDTATPHFERSNEPAIEVDLANAHGG